MGVGATLNCETGGNSCSVTVTGGADALLSWDTLARLDGGTAAFEAQSSLEARVGYGMPA